MVRRTPDVAARCGRIEHVADVVVGGDFGDTEEAGAVGAAVALLKLALMRQKRRALHEEHREGCHADVAHAIGRVHAAALVREGPGTLAVIRAANEHRHGTPGIPLRRSCKSVSAAANGVQHQLCIEPGGQESPKGLSLTAASTAAGLCASGSTAAA